MTVGENAADRAPWKDLPATRIHRTNLVNQDGVRGTRHPNGSTGNDYYAIAWLS